MRGPVVRGAAVLRGLALAVGLASVTVTATAAASEPASGPASESAMRVLSIGGAVTEIVYALGAGDRLVGRDTTSVFPPQAAALPDVGYIRRLSPEGVLSLGPELILAEEGAGPAEAVEAIEAASTPFVIIPDDPSPAGVLRKIDAVAAALDMPEAGAALSARVEAEIAAARAAVTAGQSRGQSEGIGPRRAIFLLSTAGGRLMAAGSDSSAERMLELAGARNALTGFSGYKQVSDEALIAAAPEVVVMMAGDSTPTPEALFAMPALAASPAAASRALVVMDGLALLGFGPRIGQAIRDLNAALYPAEG
ncbi:heme/hemin ABC transporter substrate-binding protein [Phaeovulum vinaykumarii]|uniref:Iron complex transport system substrate-binding protein n=1 Tax=Phaeovulum vinaykumarii TaxID=407234 RepID=A0A1N7JL54_9RHOB|nr:ABC transporter substrate-binding protein [Phaeovulum vinaykumarii]SIS50093.1 iron complex transport system substrate-binding protein [Phaeovulum vinaykumarii]SOB90094.1 iron complex transport system substrate-binding protein [Phaeovulum vinaykumarii]